MTVPFSLKPYGNKPHHTGLAVPVFFPLERKIQVELDNFLI